MPSNYDIGEAIATTLKAIPDLAAAMTVLDASQNPVTRISAFHYLLGQENQLLRAVYEMPAPSMLVAWRGDLGGNFDGSTIWKHRFEVYCRMGNAAGLATPVGYEKLWDIFCHKPPTGSPQNIRNMSLYPGLDIMDTPTGVPVPDEDGVDRFVITLVLPEIGDE
jgi:hypothetical protein